MPAANGQKCGTHDRPPKLSDRLGENRDCAAPAHWLSGNILAHHIQFESMTLFADSSRIGSEYRPESIESLTDHSYLAVPSSKAKDSVRSGAARRIRPALVYMSQNLTTPLRVETLSALLGLSPSHFFHLFKHATGRSPIDFLNRMRVQRATELLEDTALSIKEIAGMLGYNDQFYFCRVFKSVRGMAPSGYRAAMTGSSRRASDSAATDPERETAGDVSAREFQPSSSNMKYANSHDVTRGQPGDHAGQRSQKLANSGSPSYRHGSNGNKLSLPRLTK